jgi:hypothetical protein
MAAGKLSRYKPSTKRCPSNGKNNHKGCKRILLQHHEDLKHDPERLSTKFIADVAGCSCRIVKKKIEENSHA